MVDNGDLTQEILNKQEQIDSIQNKISSLDVSARHSKFIELNKLQRELKALRIKQARNLTNQ